MSIAHKPQTATLDDERAVPGLSNLANMQSHLARYRFIRRWIAPHHRVLETACGAGYGTQMLARQAAWVVGADYSSIAVAHARSTYPAPNLSFALMDCHKLAFQSANFDVVVSLEVFEHLEDSRTYLRECARVLRPGGRLILSTPNRDTWDIHMDSIRLEYEFHINMVNLGDLQRALRADFASCEIYGQRRTGSRLYGTLRALDVFNLRLRLFSPQRRQQLQQSLGVAPISAENADGFSFTQSQLKQANHFVAVCRKP